MIQRYLSVKTKPQTFVNMKALRAAAETTKKHDLLQDNSQKEETNLSFQLTGTFVRLETQTKH